MRNMFLILFSALFLCGCAGRVNFVMVPSAEPGKRVTKTAIPPVSLPTKVLPDNPEDPWQHCASVIVSGSYPEKVSEIENAELRRRVQITFMIQDEAAENSFIAERCMNGKLYICLINGMNNCAEKLDFTTEPNEAMRNYCSSEEMEGAILSPVITGINSAYEWRCHEGTAMITDQIAKPDTDGYDKSIWYEIPQPIEIMN